METDLPKSSKLPKAAYYLLVMYTCLMLDYACTSSTTHLFVTTKLGSSINNSKTFFYIRLFSFFLLPIGALVAESFYNKYVLSLIFYICEWVIQIIIVLTALPVFRLISQELNFVKIACGVVFQFWTGGAPDAFDGNQFDLPKDDEALTKFYMIRYGIHNFLSFCSYLYSPVAKSYAACLEEQECYYLPYITSLVFASLMVIIFLLGTKKYVITKAERLMILDVFTCEFYACKQWLLERKTNPKRHWMDYAIPKYDYDLVNDIKIVHNLLIVVSTIPIYTAVYRVAKSEWMYQAGRLDGRMGYYTFIPDHYNILNPCIVLILLPICRKYVDPVLARFKSDRILRKMMIGVASLALAFLFAGFIETSIKHEQPLLAKEDSIQLRIFNGFNCSILVRGPGLIKNSVLITPYGGYTDKHIQFRKAFRSLHFLIKSQLFNPTTVLLHATAGTALTVFIKNDDGQAVAVSYQENLEKNTNGLPVLTVIGADAPDSILIISRLGLQTPLFPHPNRIADEPLVTDLRRQVTVVADYYKFLLNGVNIKEFQLKPGGLYLITLSGSSGNFFTITEPNSVLVFWMLPQTLLILFGKIYFEVTVMQFCYSEAPMSLKIFALSFRGFGEGIGEAFSFGIIEQIVFAQDYKFYLYSVLLALNVLWIAFVGKIYKPMQIKEKTF